MKTTHEEICAERLQPRILKEEQKETVIYFVVSLVI
jgi:hypothetical protein